MDNPASSSSTGRQTNRHQALVLAALTLMALILRLLYLGKTSLWGDEILFVGLSRPTDSLADIYQRMLAGFHVVTHLPFPLMVQNLFIRILGGASSDLSLNSFVQRLPAVLWGTAAIPAVYFLTRKRLSPPAAWLSTAWMAFGMFPIYYSREAYFYAPLITLAACSLPNWLRCVEQLAVNKNIPVWPLAWFLLASTAMVYSHLTGILFQSGLALAPLLMIPIPGMSRKFRWRMFFLFLLSFIPFLLLSPFLHSLVARKNEAGLVSGTPVAGICWDVIGKFFMGHYPALNLLAILVFLLGLYGLWRAGKPDGWAPRLMALLCASMFLLIAYSSHKSQYHVRYFSVISPLLIITFSCGVWQAAQLAARCLPGRLSENNRVFAVFAGIILLFNLVVQPLFYMLTSKSVDYQAAANWVNHHVEPGGAYLLESGYELRFVGGYFATPDRLGMCPYIHGDLDVLHNRQRELLTRFPDIPWIESARHGHQPGMPYGAWTWPHQFFKSNFKVENPSSALLERYLVGMDYHGLSHINVKSYHIWYNTKEDILAMDREAGRSCTLFYPGWRFVTVQQDPRGMWAEYARFHPGISAPLKVVNNTGKECRAVVSLQMTLATKRSDAISIDLMKDTEVLSTWQLPSSGRQFQSLQSHEITIPAEGATLTLRAPFDKANGIQGILIYSAQIR